MGGRYLEIEKMEGISKIRIPMYLCIVGFIYLWLASYWIVSDQSEEEVNNY